MRFLIICLLVGLTAAFVPLTKNKEPVPGRYIIKLKEDVDPSPVLNFVYALAAIDSSVEVLQSLSGIITQNFAPWNPKHHPTSPPTILLHYQNDRPLVRIQEFDIVESIEEDGVVHVESVASWGLDRIDQENLPLDNSFQPIGYGEGVTVYIIDTGINDEHSEFEGRNLRLYSVIGGDGTDCHGHGTHCAATAAGNTYGVAREANIISIRCMQCGGAGTISDIVAALEWVAANATTPAVLSMSIGGGASQDLDEAVEAVSNKSGILVVAAAGNGGTNACTWSPPRVPSVMSVGATDETDYIWSGSNFGTCVDIMAPGVDIVSAWIGGSTATKTLDGTSMATPHVAGAAAVLLAQNTSLTPAQLKASLQVKARAGVVHTVDPETPNLLLYIGEGSGGGSVPTDPPTSPPCGSTITANGSLITSPNFPKMYDNHEHCEYYVESPSVDLAVMLKFSYFYVEEGVGCIYDQLSIYDGDSVEDDILLDACGYSTPSPVNSSSSQMFLVFKSDDSVTKYGFEANVFFVNKDSLSRCVHDVTTSGSTITSPNYPEDYNNNGHCKYTIVAKSNYKILLTFTDFNIEYASSCRYDKLRVYDGSSSSDPLISTLCGSSIPGQITSTTNKLFLHFTSDYSETYSGFKATVTFLAPARTKVEVTTPKATTEKQTTVGVTTPKSTTAKQTTVGVTTPKLTTPKLTTAKQTTVEVTTPKSTTAKQTTVGVTTPKLTTAKQTTVEVTTPKSTTAKQTTVGVNTPKLTTAKQTTVGVTTPKVTTAKQTTVGVTTTKSTTAKLTTIGSTGGEKTTVKDSTSSSS